jgi:hypothetical protein
LKPVKLIKLTIRDAPEKLTPGFVPPGDSICFNKQALQDEPFTQSPCFKTVQTIVCYSKFLLKLTELKSVPASNLSSSGTQKNEKIPLSPRNTAKVN